MQGRSERLLGRVNNSRRVHRYPLRAAQAIVRARAESEWLFSQRLRAEALTGMRTLLGNLSEAALANHAQAFLYERAKRSEVRWRLPDLQQPIVGVSNLEKAASAGRGVVLHFLHHGQYDGLAAAVRRVPVRLHVLASPDLLAPEPPPHLRQHLRNVLAGGSAEDLIAAEAGAFRRMSQLLVEDNAVIAVASDLPGSLEVEFLGQPVGMASGAVRLALSTGCLVLPVTARPGRHWFETEFVLHEAIEASASSAPRDLLQRLLSLHEPAVAAWPSAVDDPPSRSRSLQRA